MAGKNLNRYRKDGSDMAIYTINGHSLERGGYRMGVQPPPYKILLSFSESSYDPSVALPSKGQWERVSAEPNVWSLIPTNSTSWYQLFYVGIIAGGCFMGTPETGGSVRLLYADLTGVTTAYRMFYGCVGLVSAEGFIGSDSLTNMYGMFDSCNNLESVTLFDSRNVTEMANLFRYCSSLESVPAFRMDSVEDLSYAFQGCSSLLSLPPIVSGSLANIQYMCIGCFNLQAVPSITTGVAIRNCWYAFQNCYRVESGALAAYNYLSARITAYATYTNCFTNCGSGTASGSAELAQIPSSWGGTGA